MKILCAYSSLTISCDHFPGFLSSREACHPIFHAPQKKLLSYLGKWAGSELTPVDSYLLFLSMLRSTDLVEFRVPATLTDKTHSIVAQNMEMLAKTISKMNTIQNPSVIFPRVAITPDTKDLSNVSYWIDSWKQTYQDFLDGHISAHDSRKLILRESALERLIKNPHKPLSSYASQIADWAALAGDFPTFSLKSPFNGESIYCSDYWKQIITKCAHEEQLFSIPRNDLIELLEHCETNVPIGSIFSNALFKILRHALDRQKNFLGLGDLDIKKSTYQILTSTDSVEDGNIRAILQVSPDHPPKPEEYPTKFAYMKAKMRYDMAKKYGTLEQKEGE